MRRTFLRATAALAGLAAPLLLATPASAGPEDGQGCVGLKSTPAAYVCVIAIDPAALPSVQQTGTTTLFDDTVCYFVACQRVTVTAPTAGLVLPSSPVLVLYYNGQYHSVTIGSLPGAPPTGGVVDAATGLANTALGIAAYAAGSVLGVLDGDAEFWFDCTVESVTDDRVDPHQGASHSGYDTWSCTTQYLV